MTTDRLISLNAAIEAVLSVPPGTPCRGLAIREALCALPDAWQPIETAPRDGSWIALAGGSIEYGWDGNTEPPYVVGQCSNWLNEETADPNWQFAWYDFGYYGEYKNPTHWMPLSEPQK
jgi:hypothetical protein